MVIYLFSHRSAAVRVVCMMQPLLRTAEMRSTLTLYNETTLAFLFIYLEFFFTVVYNIYVVVGKVRIFTTRKC